MNQNNCTRQVWPISTNLARSRRQLLTVALAMLGIACTSAVSFAQEITASDPLGDIVAEMRVVVGRLSKLATDNPTQKTQVEVVDKLDTLIAELEKECEKCRGSMSPPNPSKPANDSNIKNGPGGMGKLHAAKQDGDRWGELPAHERDRILQSMNDGFPAHYQGILESYFKRLAEEKAADDTSPAAGKKSAGTKKTSEPPAAKPSIATESK